MLIAAYIIWVFPEKGLIEWNKWLVEKSAAGTWDSQEGQLEAWSG